LKNIVTANELTRAAFFVVWLIWAAGGNNHLDV